MTPQQMNLKGSTTTINGIIAILGGALALFTEFMKAYHGQGFDVPTLAAGSSGIAGGVGLLKAADSKQ